MTQVYVNQKGYYIKGEGIEAAQSCSPKTIQGARVTTDHEHEYLILIFALKRLSKSRVRDAVVVYSSSKIIEECNGQILPETKEEAALLNSLRIHILPQIRSVVYFNKKTSQEVDAIVHDAKKNLIELTPEQKKQLEKVREKARADARERASRAIQNLKNRYGNKNSAYPNPSRKT